MAETTTFKATTMSKAELANYYKISPDTLLTWLARVPDLGDFKKVKLFTPAEVTKILNHLGTQ